MRRPPLILWGASAVTWALTGAATAGGARTRVWLCSLGVSLVSTNAAVMASAVSDRIDRAYVAMAKAFATRPDDGERLAKVIVGALAEVSRPGASTAPPGPRKIPSRHEVVVPFPVRQKS
jgi:hypothetical protein